MCHHISRLLCKFIIVNLSQYLHTYPTNSSQISYFKIKQKIFRENEPYHIISCCRRRYSIEYRMFLNFHRIRRGLIVTFNILTSAINHFEFSAGINKLIISSLFNMAMEQNTIHSTRSKINKPWRQSTNSQLS